MLLSEGDEEGEEKTQGGNAITGIRNRNNNSLLAAAMSHYKIQRKENELIQDTRNGDLAI